MAWWGGRQATAPHCPPHATHPSRHSPPPTAPLKLTITCFDVVRCRPQLGRPVPEYLSAANDEVALLVQCETKQCYDGLEVWVGGVGGRGGGGGIGEGRTQSKARQGEPLAAAACCARSPADAAVDAVSQRVRAASLAMYLPRCTCPPALLDRPPSLAPLQSVLSVPGVDCCFVGPVDLSHALGFAQSQGFPACFDSPDFKASPFLISASHTCLTTGNLSSQMWQHSWTAARMRAAAALLNE